MRGIARLGRHDRGRTAHQRHAGHPEPVDGSLSALERKGALESLTGCWNIRGFCGLLALGVDDARSRGTDLAICGTRIDDFDALADAARVSLSTRLLDATIETVVHTNDRPVVHPDHRAHYRWPGWLSRIADAKLVRSMSRKGSSPDNAACERFFSRLKEELFYPRNWQSTTIEQFMQAVNFYIRWYNEQRI